ncbi:MAG: NAD-specific glutamate dehydrogenase [Porticoccaceae bacterium]|nr:MAG: NAD-specific glutamate dehydrogenase [Porticoccaceae bacterium]
MSRSQPHSHPAFLHNLRLWFEQHAPERAAALVHFAERFFRLAPARELDREATADLAGLVLALHRFLEEAPLDGPKVRSFNPTLEEDGFEHPHTQLFILQRDMAFIVDSVNLALHRRGLRVHASYSAIFHAVRDSAGRLLRLLDEPGAESRPEALVLFQVDRYLAPEAHLQMNAEVREVLACVAAVNDDYHPSLARLDEARSALAASGAADEEELAFLGWLRDNHFTFLAYSHCRLERRGPHRLVPEPERALGLFRHRPRVRPPVRVSALPAVLRDFHRGKATTLLAKSTHRAEVHRDAYCDYVLVKDVDERGRIRGEHRFLGLYTSAVYTRSPFEIPLVRRKLVRIFERSGLDPKSHDGKALLQIIETHPREELLLADEETLYRTLIGIWQIKERRQVRLFARLDPFGHFASAIVFVPRDSYRTEIRERIEGLLRASFGASEAQFSTYFSESALARTHFVLRLAPGPRPQVEVEELERAIAALARDWRDDLKAAILEHWGGELGLSLAARYRDAFPVSYQAHFDPRAAVHDIALCDGLRPGQIAIAPYRPPEGEGIQLKLFHGGTQLPLSAIVPMLENLGFTVIGEHPYRISPASGDPIWLHDFSLRYRFDTPVDVPAVRDSFVEAFKAVWYGLADDDRFNGLVVGARLDWRSVALLRSYARYMKQLGLSLGQDFIAATLARHVEITRNLIALFKARFDPRQVTPGDRAGRAERLRERILAALEGVANLNEDQVLRTYLDLIWATVRTNFFRRDERGTPRPYIALKLLPERTLSVPEPRFRYEVFVHSPRFEGIHIRTAKVARGGIRWSDRVEDFRTEILGLVRAQQVKNALIVPAGAKGGFVTRRSPAGGEERLREGQACYRQFIEGLLDLTDNLVDGRVVPPAEVVCLDEPDSYLVVAADKGTATFSDLANEIACARGYWLGDAFASGGSNGYDHKKMGITAKGAWVAVQRHFRELGIDVQQEPITVVGIGDMSGDVFGNGMLLSPHIRLLAAFNRDWIFVDPDPDPAVAYAERRRLFLLPGSNWCDYDAALISRGGGVFSRSAKWIQVTPEMRSALALEGDRLTPDQLIRGLLKSPVDLIWNGGIGTYVKGEGESHEQVGDRANDGVRVNGAELRCRVFAEGGNLGMTQRGRIEYALAGGACNADFIDNSGGVDCSDQEVNLKIALDRLVAEEELTRKQRNRLLAAMEREVEERVLGHSYRQTQAISLARLRSRSHLSEFAHCLADWEAAGHLDRRREVLPDEETLAEREKGGLGLTRPELAVLLSHAKILLKQALLTTELHREAAVAKEIARAFPRLLVERHPEAIERHALRRELLATELANQIVDTMGIAYAHRLMAATGADAAAVVRAFLVVREVLELERVWREIEGLDYRLDAGRQLELLERLMRLGRRASRWVIRNRRGCLDVAAEVASLKPLLGALLSENLDRLEEGDAELLGVGLSPYAVMLLDASADLFFAFGMADVALRTGADLELVGEVYRRLDECLELGWFSEQLIALPAANRWEDFARESFIDQLEGDWRALAAVLVEGARDRDELEGRLQSWLQAEELLVARWQGVVAELKSAGERRYPMFAVALREFEDLVEDSRQESALGALCGFARLAEGDASR